ncbi:fatty acid desaturase [Roseibacillus persicicus]|uniref:Rubredoxin-like domain-containing protein n=1 Tax=Roseibacillus persicicus TaxID=454148 RepID=A0A918TU54_9BACT|nr:hypothetical protein GCM10007100_31750 [Roseibacillus persicicus]
MELDKPNIKINWRRSALAPETLASLNERSNLLGALQTGGFLLVLLLTGITSFYFWLQKDWWLFAIALFAHGTVTSFCINAVHELVHGTVFRTPWLNDFFANLFGFIGLVNPHMFWFSHAEHHKFTLHPPDDLEVTLPVYHSKAKYLTSALLNVHCYHDFVILFRHSCGIFRGPWETVIVPNKPEDRKRKVVNWSRMALLLHLIILVASIASGLWIIPVLTTFTGAYGAWLFYLCNFTQHAGLTENIDDFRLNCRTIYLNPVTRFLYWHMNWHIEHHMYAAVPCYRLHRLHRAIKHELPHCPRGLVEAWIEIAYIQYRRRRDPDYRFIPELPSPDQENEPQSSRLKQIHDQAEQRLAEQAQAEAPSGRRWQCRVCGFVYYESKGLPEEGIAPGTAWEDIPDDWRCPDCGVRKAQFHMEELSEKEELPES